MGGKIKSISSDGIVKINLNGRLGIINIPKEFVLNQEKLDQGGKLKFFFSYLQVSEYEIGHDIADFNKEYGMNPTLIGGRIRVVNDTAVEVDILGGRAEVIVPRRWLFTEKKLEENLNCEMYLSCMEVVD